MPRTFMNRHLEEKKTAMDRLEFNPRTGAVDLGEPVVIDGTIPPLPDLQEPLGVEGMESFNRDWSNIVEMVRHGLVLREVLNGIVQQHKAEGEPAIELPTKPRERAEAIVKVMMPWKMRYDPILHAIQEWMQALGELRRFHGGRGGKALSLALSSAIQSMNRPIHALSSLPATPTDLDPDDLRSLEDALSVARQVKATVEDLWSAPQTFRQALRGVLDTFERLRDHIDENTRTGYADGFTVNSWTTISPAPPLPGYDRIPQGVAPSAPQRYEGSVDHNWP